MTLVSANAATRADSLLMQYLREQGLKEYRFATTQFYVTAVAKYEALLADLEKAQKSVDMEYFIFANDTIANQVLDILRQAVKRGVKVRIIVDGYKDKVRGFNYQGNVAAKLRKEGIDLVVFDPWKFPYLNHVPRDHRKIVVIDGKVGYLGGMNIADYYMHGREGMKSEWRDLHMRITGEACKGLQLMFEKSWQVANNPDSKILFIPQQEETNIGSAWDVQSAERGRIAVFFERTRESRRKKAETREAFKAAFASVQDTLRLISPYFMPTRSVRKALIAAADRGVVIQILHSKEGDIALLAHGNRHFAKKMLKHGAEVYLHRTAFHHSKFLTADGQFAMVGSANLNARSLSFDYEASCFLFDEPVTSQLNAMFNSELQKCDTLTLRNYDKLPLGERIIGWIVDNILSPCL